MAVPVLKCAAEMLHKVNPDMTVRSMLLLCAVAAEERQSVSDYAERVGMPVSTASRLLLDLSDSSRSEKHPVGAGLLSRAESPESMRVIVYSLTHKGRNVFRKINAEVRRASAQAV